MGWILVTKRLIFLSFLVVFLCLGGLLVNINQITAAPHLNDLNSGSLMDALFAIMLAALVLFISAGLGRILIKPFGFTSWTFIEQTVISLPLGLAVVGYGEFFLGLVGWIKPIHHVAWLIIISCLAFKNSLTFLNESIINIKTFNDTWRNFSFIKKTFFSVGTLALLLGLLQTLTPPYDYDGLMYHLQGPRLFLEAGKIIPIPENWFTYYPSTWEMIYMLGMGLGSDIFARLIHFSTLILFLLATFAFGRRFLSPLGGWLAAAILVGMPILLMWGTFAYTDIAWALFQFLAIALFVIWGLNNNENILLVSGIMQGLALGSKYLAFSGAGIIMLGLIWYSFRRFKVKNTWKLVVKNVLIFGIATSVIALPWYLKNYFWTGNPLFPFYLPQNVINPAELNIVVEYVNSFGTGKEWYDYLFLPFNLIFNYQAFATFLGNVDIFSPIFLFAMLYPWIRKRLLTKSREFLDLLAILTALQFIMWAFGSQQNRFLLPLYSGLSILASSVILHMPISFNLIRWNRVLGIGVVGGMLIGSTLIVTRYFSVIHPYTVLFGLQTKSDFLSEIVYGFSTVEYINKYLPDSSRVLFFLDGRGYYCNDKCFPDIGPAKWTSVVARSANVDENIDWLKHNEFTHFYLALPDHYFYIPSHDPTGQHLTAEKYFFNDFAPNYTKEIFSDQVTSLYQFLLE